MRRADLWSGIVLAIVGIVSIFVLIPWQIAPGPAGYMSPRLVPTMMMVLVTGLALLMILRNIAPRPDEEGAVIFSRGEALAALRVALVFAVALALYHWATPLIAGIAIVFGGLVALGERRPLVLLAMPGILMLLIWLLFYKLLGTAIV